MVVFDLGGVLVNIAHTWEKAAEVAGVRMNRPEGHETAFSELPAYNVYQNGQISEDEYLAALAAWAGVTHDEAVRIHCGILIVQYPGVEELIAEVAARGLRVGCLSNTNDAHWQDLIGPRFPAIQAMENRMASQIVGLSKPDPAIFHLYAKIYGVAPEEILYFDDNAENVASANNVGFRAYQIDPENDPPAQMRRIVEDQFGMSK